MKTTAGRLLHGCLPIAIAVALLGLLSGAASFRPAAVPSRRGQQRPLAAATTGTGATLTEETTWTMRMNLENLPTEKGKRTSGIYVVQAKFIEEEGYEPPQGLLQQVFPGQEASASEDGEAASTVDTQMKIASGRWTLSEDPEDRKDSLWIWGLFKDPLYPFLLLQFEVEEMALPGEEKDSIKPFKLFAQINHKREDGEVILASVTDLTVREKETYKADPFGAAKIDLFENVVVGKLQLQAQ
ncbi:unnamed protein product [Pseudo-nitzschia multistriata]|uniref:Uncharacterized protein n=1 Tax=Pseudo-nitzschia multistriata TaxID=183589 RepID=A0A448Z5B3_9STRA|nr:unnamed protein product [Pseudo-nitzschia multistriata]